MKKTHNISVTTGKYQKDGQEKSRYVIIGSVFTDDSGRMKMKIDNAHPTMDGGWNGWANFYPVDENVRPRGAPILDDDAPF
jgi:hypothetical protein